MASLQSAHSLTGRCRLTCQTQDVLIPAWVSCLGGGRPVCEGGDCSHARHFHQEIVRRRHIGRPHMPITKPLQILLLAVPRVSIFMSSAHRRLRCVVSSVVPSTRKAAQCMFFGPQGGLFPCLFPLAQRRRQPAVSDSRSPCYDSFSLLTLLRHSFGKATGRASAHQRTKERQLAGTQFSQMSGRYHPSFRPRLYSGPLPSCLA